MSSSDRKTKLEYGDFQTPLVLAEMVCRKLVELNVNPNTIIEPTCGVGNFIEAAQIECLNLSESSTAGRYSHIDSLKI
jgi:hypothetical protein